MTTPIERTTQYATICDDLPNAWAFVMERIDTLGPNPRITISPLWAHHLADMNDPDAPEPKRQFEVSVSGMTHEDA